MKKPLSPIINTDDALLLLNTPGIVWVDARGGPQAYERYCAGHLQDAVFTDLENELSHKSVDASQGGRHPLPDPATFGSMLSKMGISPDSHVIVYDDKGGANAAARFWWMMKAAGHKQIQVIDGGYSAIAERGLPISKKTSEPLPTLQSYPVNHWQLPTVSIENVAEAITKKDFLVIDVRESFRYKGESEPIDLVAGHIPGAVNLPYLNNLEADGNFRSPDALAAQYQNVIGNRDLQKVIVHCGSGVTACHTLLAMEYAGIKGASLYVGSWSEWSRNERPVATGESPG